MVSLRMSVRTTRRSDEWDNVRYTGDIRPYRVFP